MVEIRTPDNQDAPAISELLHALGYPDTGNFIERRIAQLRDHPDAALLVAVDEGAVVGVIALHFIPQLALAGDFCRIGYLCVSEHARGRGIGARLEEAALELARQRGCVRMELHCHARRTDAHRFYRRLHYADSPIYFCKPVD